MRKGRRTMARLIYSAIMSLDGYVADEHGTFDWAAPDAEVHVYINELERPIGTYLYGRRMYETMLAWEDADAFADQPAYVRDFAAIWQAADKIVYSTTLMTATSTRTQLEPEFQMEDIWHLKQRAERDLTVGGAMLAAQAFAAGLVDECQLFLVPVIVGGGTPALPRHAHQPLALLEQRQFGNGTVYLRYQVGA